jgi:AcrR family transcriptional regulator
MEATANIATDGVALKRTRKRADDRIADLLAVADGVVQKSRSADLSLQEVADSIGISRALVYAYFADRYRLLDAVLARHVNWLEASGLSHASQSGNLVDRAVACGEIVLQHVVTRGPTLELILRERDVARQLDRGAELYLRKIVRCLAMQAAVELRMGVQEAFAFIELLSAIPQEAGRRVLQDGVDIAIAQSVSERLIRASIEAQVPLKPREQGAVS